MARSSTWLAGSRMAYATPRSSSAPVDRGERKGRVGANDDGLVPILVTIDDGQEDLLPPGRTGDVARSELGGQAVALLIEDEERMVADGLEVAVVRRLLLRAVDRALGAIDVEDHASRGPPNRFALHDVRVEASESLIVVLLSEHLRFEPVHRGGERDAGLSSLTRGQHPKRRIHGQPLRVVGVLVARQPTVDGLAKEIRKRELPIASAARVGEVSLDERAEADVLVQLTRQQLSSIGGDRRAPDPVARGHGTSA